VCVPLLCCDVRKNRFIFSRGVKLTNVCTVQMLVNPLTYRRFPIYAVIMFRMIRRKSNSAHVGIRYNMARCVGVYKGVQQESQLRHTGDWSAKARPPRHLSDPSAVFFRQFVYIAISSAQQKNVIIQVGCCFTVLLALNCVTWIRVNRGAPASKR
jgi:hypothetical protein